MTAALPLGTRVRCHKNLHRGDWSITVRGKVVAHMAEVCLADVTFKVRETARQQVIARKCRQVHAWCEGVIVARPCDLPETEITYNPYRCGDFTTRDGEVISRCEFVHFTDGHGAIALGQVE